MFPYDDHSLEQGLDEVPAPMSLEGDDYVERFASRGMPCAQ